MDGWVDGCVCVCVCVYVCMYVFIQYKCKLQTLGVKTHQCYRSLIATAVNPKTDRSELY